MTAKELLEQGWEVERLSFYDEEGLEGWRWTSPDGEVYWTLGDWSEPPVPPEEEDLT